MADLRFESPTTTAEFETWLRHQNAPTPWQASAAGEVFDADGNLVLQVDPERDRADDKVAQIAAAVIVAVNTCAGFKAAAKPAAAPAAPPPEAAP